jgi:transcriptional regulator with XRE-family HTH domain
MNLTELANAFKDARLSRRLSQLEVAKATGISRLTITKFESGASQEIGVLKLLSLFQKVGLELQARPAGQRRTLKDIEIELDSAVDGEVAATARKPQRVRHKRGSA